MENHRTEAGLWRGSILGDKDLHIWQASLRQAPETVRQLAAMLSQDELQRSARFHFAHDRDAFIVARGVLRCLLAGYLNCERHELSFAYEQAGKPYLATRFANQVHFNLSHSKDVVVYAISRQPNVGIDVEYIRPIDDMEQIAASNFSAGENAQLRSLPHSLAVEGFFNCWTRKEAFVKAMGSGISFPLQSFDVSLKPGEPARLLRVAGSESEAARWFMSDLTTSAGYAAAVVAEGTGYSIAHREWTALLSTPNI